MSDYAEPDFDEDFEEAPPPVTFYTQMNGERTNYPFSVDCSGLVWWCYNQSGHADTLFPTPNAGVADQIRYFETTHWRHADLVLQWNHNTSSTRLARLTLNQTDFLAEGDLLYRWNSPSGDGDHVSFFLGWDGTRVKILDAHPSSTPVVGERTISYDYLVNTYTHVVRSQVIGSYMAYRYLAGVRRPVEVTP